MLTLQNLTKLGLFRKQESARHIYSQMRRALRLIVDDVNEQNPNDISYVYSGYAPLSIRLVQAACQKTLGGGMVPIPPTNPVASGFAPSWKEWDEPLKLLPGP